MAVVDSRYTGFSWRSLSAAEMRDSFAQTNTD